MAALIFEHFPLMYKVILKFYMLLGSLVVFLLFGCNFFISCFTGMPRSRKTASHLVYYGIM